jgi:transposase
MLKQAAGKLTVGIDLGDRLSHVCWLDADGEVVEESRLASTPAAFQRRFQGEAPCRVVMEVGPHSRWSSQLLKKLGHEVIVANARQVGLIAESDQKDDPVDAELLARLGRVDPKLLRPLEHREEGMQTDLSVLRARDVLVSARRNLINSARGMVKAAGGRLPACATESFPAKAAPHIPTELWPALEGVLATLVLLNQQIRKYDEQIETLCAKYPATQRLRQIRGVGPITAVAFVLTLGDPHRFRDSRAVGPYLGLCRKRRKSGETDPELGISKAGNPYMRRILLQAAHYILGPFGPDCDLRRFGERLAQGGRSGRKRAVVAVARKLAVLLHRLWVTETEYEPLRHASQAGSAARV